MEIDGQPYFISYKVTGPVYFFSLNLLTNGALFLLQLWFRPKKEETVGLQQGGFKLDVRKEFGLSGALSSGRVSIFRGPFCEVSSGGGGNLGHGLCTPPLAPGFLALHTFTRR